MKLKNFGNDIATIFFLEGSNMRPRQQTEYSFHSLKELLFFGSEISELTSQNNS